MIAIEDRRRTLNDELGRIVDILQRDYRPEKIILFGSLAADRVSEWSDIDLLIIKDTDKRPIERNIEVCRLVRPAVGIDLFIYTPQEFKALLEERYTFILNILKTGKTLYEKRS
jgi:predicted nucleotidyltransferase